MKKTHQYRPIRHARVLRDHYGLAVDLAEHNGRHRRPERQRIPWNLIAGDRGDPYRADDCCHERFRGRWLDSGRGDNELGEREYEEFLKLTRLRRKARRLHNRRKTRQVKLQIRTQICEPTLD